MPETNKSWISRLSGSGAQQEAALVELHSTLMRALRRAIGDRLTGRDEFVEDIAQQAVIKVLENLPQFQGRSRFLTWATSIAIRAAFSELRKQQWKDVSMEEVVEPAGELFELSIEEVSDSTAQWQDLIDAMYDVINTKLTDKQRTALIAELKGMPQEEIARQMGSNRNAVYKLTHDARRQLKRHLEAAGYTDTEVRALIGATK